MIFANFVLQAHAANVWDNPKAPEADALVVDRPILRANWYLFVLW